jgi:hypothetical protein
MADTQPCGEQLIQLAVSRWIKRNEEIQKELNALSEEHARNRAAIEAAQDPKFKGILPEMMELMLKTLTSKSDGEKPMIIGAGIVGAGQPITGQVTTFNDVTVRTIPTFEGPVSVSTHRTPFAEHRQRLIQFLANNGPATRNEITAITGIPPGSLSALLTNADFESAGKGYWRLQGTEGIPGASAQPKSEEPNTSSEPAKGPEFLLRRYHKLVCDLLQKKGLRADKECIARVTGIPLDTLTQLLKEDIYEEIEGGFWRLKKPTNQVIAADGRVIQPGTLPTTN